MDRPSLILSPHLDDAVLSCAIYLQRNPGTRVATLFTRGPSAHYRVRRMDDRRAAAMLGARAVHCGFLDAPYRSRHYSGFHGIVFGRASEYPRTRQRLTSAIRRLIQQLQPRCILAPLAAGNHVDHRLVRDAALGAADPRLLLFYEDRPYALVREHVAHALGCSISAQPERFWARYLHTTYIRSYLGAMPVRELVSHWRAVPPFPRPLRIAEILHPTVVESRAAARAIAAYSTEWPLLYENLEDLRLACRLTETYYALT